MTFADWIETIGITGVVFYAIVAITLDCKELWKERVYVRKHGRR